MKKTVGKLQKNRCLHSKVNVLNVEKLHLKKNYIFVSFDAEFIFLYYKYIIIPDVKKSKLY